MGVFKIEVSNMSFFLFSPLEQFEVRVLKPMTFIRLDVSFTVMSLFLLLAISCAFGFLYFGGSYKVFLVPTPLQSIVELSYRFLYGMLYQQAGSKASFFFPLIFVTFFFILSSNVIGLLAFSFTPTSHILITFFLAFSFNFCFLYFGFAWHKLRFLKLFVPSGVPRSLLPLMISIEVLSYLIRTISLSVRLFANMLAGHTLLFIFASFVRGLLRTSFLKILAVVPFCFLFAIFVLEIGIAFLQSYVFVLLLCIYLKDSLSPGH